MKQIKTFEEACEKLSLSSAIPDVSQLPEEFQKPVIANYKLMVIAKALNDGWEPNWDNSNETKYFPWFDMEGQRDSGSGLAFLDYDHWRSLTVVGSRLCFKTRELAKYAGETFLALYGEMMVIRK